MCACACIIYADTLGASAFTWSACCTSRSRRARLIYGGRINYKEEIEKSVDRLWGAGVSNYLPFLRSEERSIISPASRNFAVEPSSRSPRTRRCLLVYFLGTLPEVQDSRAKVYLNKLLLSIVFNLWSSKTHQLGTILYLHFKNS